MPTLGKKNLVNLSLVLVSVSASVFLAEIALQLLEKPSPPASGWRSNRSNSENNQLGFRGQPINYSQDDYVIVLLGDSQVEATACAYEWMPERRLQYYLNNKNTKTQNKYKVFTIGAGGYGQDQQLLVMHEYFQRYRADLVILWQVPDNDVWNNIFPTHWPKNGWPKPTFRLIGNELHGPSENMGDPVNWTGIRLLLLLNRVLRPDRDSEWEKYLPPPYEPIRDYLGPARKDWQERSNNNLGFWRHENLQNEKSHLALSLTPVSPRTQYGLDLTRKLLQEIEKLVTVHNGKLLIFDIETPKGEHYETGDNEVVHLLNGKYYKTSRKEYVDNVTYINRGFTYFTVPVTISQWRVGPEDSHANEHAVDQVMKDFAEKLRRFIES